MQNECITVCATKLMYCFSENVFNDILWDKFFFIKDNFQSSGRREFNISVSYRISVKDRRRTEEYCKTRV